MIQYLQDSTWYTDKQRADREANVGNKDTLPLLVFAIGLVQYFFTKIPNTGLLDGLKIFRFLY